MSAYTDMIARLRYKVGEPLTGQDLAKAVRESLTKVSSVPIRFSDDPEARQAAAQLAQEVEAGFASQNGLSEAALTERRLASQVPIYGRSSMMARGPFQGDSPVERLRDEVRHLQGQLRYWRQQHDCDVAAVERLTEANAKLAQRALVAEMGLRELQARRLSEFMCEHVEQPVEEKPKSSMPANALRFGNGRYDKRPL